MRCQCCFWSTNRRSFVLLRDLKAEYLLDIQYVVACFHCDIHLNICTFNSLVAFDGQPPEFVGLWCCEIRKHWCKWRELDA